MIITLFGDPRAIAARLWRPLRRLMGGPQRARVDARVDDREVSRRAGGWVMLSDVAGSEMLGRGRLVTWRESGTGEAARLRGRIESFTPSGSPVTAGAEVRLVWERADATHTATVRGVDEAGAMIDLAWHDDDLPRALEEQQIGEG